MLAKEFSALKDKNERLFAKAAKEGSVPALRALLRKPDTNPAANKNLPLRLAVENGHAGIVEQLLKDNRVDPTAENNFAIRAAVKGGHTEVLKLLMADKRIDPAMENNFLIRLAAEKGNAEVVKLLIADKRVDPSGMNDLAFYIAAKSGHAEVVRLLLEDKRVNPVGRDNGAIMIAAKSGHAEVVKLLMLDMRIDLAAITEAFRIAVEKGQAEVVKLLLEDRRINPVANSNKSIRIAAESGHTEVVKVLLEDKRVDPAVSNNDVLHRAAAYGHTEVVKLLLEDKRINPALKNSYSIRIAAENGHAEVVKLLLKDARVDPSEAIRIAAENGRTEVVKLLLEDKRINPADSLADANGHIEVVKLLLKDKRVNPAARNNLAICIAAEKGHTEVVRLLLEDKRVDPAARNFQAIRNAAKSGHTEIVKLLLEHTKFHDLPFSEIIDVNTLNAKEIGEFCVQFIANPLYYLDEKKSNTKISPAQIAALRIILLKEEVAKMEESEKKRIAEDPENAMNDSGVVSANEAFEKLVKPKFEKKFLEYTPNNPEEAKKAKINRELILEEIDKKSQDPQLKQFIEQNKAELVEGTNEQLMTEAREKYFNSPTDPNHATWRKYDPKIQTICAIEEQIRGLILIEIAKNSPQPIKDFIENNKEELKKGTNQEKMAQATKYFNSLKDQSHVAWRGFDPNAESKGHANLLTEQTEVKDIFTTRVAAQNIANLTNTVASDLVRERLAYYYLVVQDKDEETSPNTKQEDIDNRVANFISELSDLRRAHSGDHVGNPDAPTCYPGYLGRIANLGYGHPLTQKTVTKKMLIQDIMRVIILEEFKKLLSNEKGLVGCEKDLNALSYLSEKIQTDQRIFTKDEKYPNELLKIREKFIDSFELGTLYKRVNDELIALGNIPMTEEEKQYVLQYVLDPCRGKMMGPIGDAYKQHIETAYAAELAETKKQEQMELESHQKAMMDLSKIANPYQTKYDQMARMAKANPALFNPRLRILQDKINNYQKLAEYLLNKLITGGIKQEEQIGGIMLLLETMTEVAYNKGLKQIDNNNVEVTCEKLFKKADDTYRTTLDEALSEKTDMDAYLPIPVFLDSIDKHYYPQQDSAQKRLKE